MFTEMDEGKGLVKTDWNAIRKRVAKVEPVFAKIVDEINPGKNFPVFLAYFPYGALEGDTQSSFLPKCGGGYYRLSDLDIPKEIGKHLGYGKDSSPLGMVLDKELEFFIDLKSENTSIPWLMYKPGKLFPFSRILSKNNHRIYAPNGLLSVTAGARSTFMLPNIGSAINHSNLQRDFNVQSPPPKSLYEHWHVFKEIVNSEAIDSSWRCCVMYFSEKWVTSIHTDKTWASLKQYLHELAWTQFEYERNRVYYDIAFSMIQQKRNLKPNPYLADTARHLFTTALGAAPGYAPALNDNALPLDVLQKVFVESYGLKKYIPTIMQPMHFYLENQSLPVYYSLQNPSTHVFSPKSRQASSTIFEMRELEHIMKIFAHELSDEQGICSETIIGTVAKNLKFNYFHNKNDGHRAIKSSAEIPFLDARFSHINENLKTNGATFAGDASFVRGCISIST